MTNMRPIRAGTRFTHKHFLDPNWKPKNGQRFSDCPLARMRVTKTTKMAVYYTYVDAIGPGWRMARSDFERAYGDQIWGLS